MPRQVTPSAPTPVSPARQSGQRAQPEGKKAAWKPLAVISALALVVLAAAFWLLARRSNLVPATTALPNSPASVTPSPAAPAMRREVAAYRITRKQAVANLRTLPLDLSVQSGERIIFEFKLWQPGAIYLMAENGDHSWRWLDATPGGQAPVLPAGRWIETPKDSWYVLDTKAGAETFWLLYLPQGMNWSLAEAIAPARTVIERAGNWEGTAVLEPEAADRLLRWLQANAAEMTAAGRQVKGQEGDEVLFDLQRAENSRQPSYHRIELKHVD